MFKSIRKKGVWLVKFSTFIWNNPRIVLIFRSKFASLSIVSYSGFSLVFTLVTGDFIIVFLRCFTRKRVAHKQVDTVWMKYGPKLRFPYEWLERGAFYESRGASSSVSLKQLLKMSKNQRKPVNGNNQMPKIMVFRPTYEEMELGFGHYIKYMETKGAHKAGLAKVSLIILQNPTVQRWLCV